MRKGQPDERKRKEDKSVPVQGSFLIRNLGDPPHVVLFIGLFLMRKQSTVITQPPPKTCSVDLYNWFLCATTQGLHGQIYAATATAAPRAIYIP